MPDADRTGGGGCFLCEPRPIRIANDVTKLLDPTARERIAAIAKRLEGVEPWDEATLEPRVAPTPKRNAVGFGKLAQPLRVALTGSTVSPGLFEVMAVLGKDEALARMDDAAQGRNGEKKGRS